METALLQYPMDKVFARLQKILKKRGYSIITLDPYQGVIKARKRRFFQKAIALDINASRIDDKATRVDLAINPHLLQEKESLENSKEKDLWNCIYNNF